MSNEQTINGVPRNFFQTAVTLCHLLGVPPSSKQAVALRALLDADKRPEGCCCPPKGHCGIWAGAMCPIHFGLRAIKPQVEQPVAENKNQFDVNRFMIMKFDTREESLLQHSVSMSLDNCRSMIKSLRERHPDEEYSIVAVLDE